MGDIYDPGFSVFKKCSCIDENALVRVKDRAAVHVSCNNNFCFRNVGFYKFFNKAGVEYPCA